MTRQELLDALTVERFTVRPHPDQRPVTKAEAAANLADLAATVGDGTPTARKP